VSSVHSHVNRKIVGIFSVVLAANYRNEGSKRSKVDPPSRGDAASGPCCFPRVVRDGHVAIAGHRQRASSATSVDLGFGDTPEVSTCEELDAKRQHAVGP
jgi:hypothetical protein